MGDSNQQMEKIGGLGPSALGFESGYPPSNNPFQKGDPKESKPPTTS